jgi:hypothetical protein
MPLISLCAATTLVLCALLDVREEQESVMHVPTPPARAKARTSLAWNDIETLPVYAALLLCAGFLWLIATEMTSALEISALKAIGVMGCLALRHAWLQLDEDGSPV